LTDGPNVPVSAREGPDPGAPCATARDDLRNVAIIAHVDHGKTTLVDAMLRQTGAFRSGQAVEERVLDSHPLERERGITILAKNTSVIYRGTKINIVDTPGHADFGGEVERILGTVDGALLVVDAWEGPMPQTRFVLEKALARRLKILLVVNKIDRPGVEPDRVVDQVLDLFLALGADEEQIDFPVVYASGRLGVAFRRLPRPLDPASLGAAAESEGIRPLLEAIREEVPAPPGDADGPLQILISTLDYDDYVGRIGIGRVWSGCLRAGAPVAVGHGPGAPLRPARAVHVFTFVNLRRVPAQEVSAGDIVAVAGIEDLAIGDTVTSPDRPAVLPPLEVEPPRLTMTFAVNDSPFAGREGRFVTSRHLRERLFREAQHNVGLRVEETADPDAFAVSGRGELHLAVLIETMRREGYELQVSRPQVILRHGPDGSAEEPFEELVADVPEEAVGAVMEALGARRGDLEAMHPAGEGRVRLVYRAPARGLVGFASEFAALTRGYGVMSHTFAGYGPFRGPIPGRARGSLVAWESGVTTAYALENAEQRGVLFVGPGVPVYAGQIVGENAREGDLEINVCKRKHLTNVRSSTGEEEIKLTPPRVLSLEEALAWIRDDERVEVTPASIRLRKRVLDRNQRARLRGAGG
jgi:GTP-binding protein